MPHAPEPAAPREAEVGEPRDDSPLAVVRRWTTGRGRVAASAALLLVLLLGAVALGTSDTDAGGPRTVPLSTAVAHLEAGRVTHAEISDGSSGVVLTLQDGSTVRASYPAAYSDELTTQLLAAHVPMDTTLPPNRTWMDVVLTVVPVVIIVVFLLWLVKSGAMTGGVGRFSGSRGKALGEVPSARFTDVAGCDEAVAELREMVDFLADGQRFARVGAKPPRGALLVGPPGTGKTLLARAVAGEAGVPFFAVAGSDFVESFAGVGARRARDLFDRARKAGRAIVFIDEIDAVGKARSDAPSHGGDSERENTLISLLNEMDGFAATEVVVLAATNRADLLDPALVRPGRLDRQVQVPNPDRRGRTDILRVHARGRPLAEDVDLVSVARQTPGLSGAELAQVVNEACLEAGRRELSVVTQECFQCAVATVAMGRARESALVSEHDRAVTAWHEAGHTVAALVLPEADDPVSVTIVPRGPAGGVTWMSGSDDVFLTRPRALARLTSALAGRAAEERLLGGEFTQGAAGDLQSATGLAEAMVTKYGMTDFGYAQVDDDTLRMGGPVALSAREHVDGLLREAHQRAERLLEENADLLEALAAALLEEETLSTRRIEQLRDAVLAARPGAAADACLPAARVAADLPAAHVAADLPAARRAVHEDEPAPR